MLNDTVSTEKFIVGIKYGLLVEMGILAVLLFLWYLFIGTIVSFPIAVLTFGFGGIYFTVAGCIGPGRYEKEYKILLYTPESGSSYSDTIKVSGFVLDDTKKADIIVNGKKVDVIEFDSNGMGEAEISRQDFIYETINTIYLENSGETSNASNFTLFEYTEDMTDEEIDELIEMESQPPIKSLQEAKESYIERKTGRIGSIAVGLGTLGLLNFLSGIVLHSLFGILY